MSKFSIKIRTRHPSQMPLRKLLPASNVRAIVRFGSSTPVKEVYPKFAGKRPIVEINTVDAVKVSANKLLMKQAFTNAGVITSDWWTIGVPKHANAPGNYAFLIASNPDKELEVKEIPFPIVAKHIFGSRGTGNTLLKSQQELEAFIKGKDLSKYIFEKYYSYNREYRLHVTKNGCFYTCRKMLKTDVPQEQRWFRNDKNSVWIVESNEQFDKPVNWDAIVADAVKALVAVGLDVGALDVRVQSSKNSDGKTIENPKWIIIETNSAPGLAEIGLQKYVDVIPQLISEKHGNKV